MQKSLLLIQEKGFFIVRTLAVRMYAGYETYSRFSSAII